MSDLKARLAHLMSPFGAGNNAYELGQLAQQQQALIEQLVVKMNNAYGALSFEKTDKLLLEALQAAKEAGYYNALEN